MIRGDLIKLSRPQHLTSRARIVIGLHNMGLEDVAEMADAIGMQVPEAPSTVRQSRRQAWMRERRAEFCAFARMILRSQQSVIRDCLERGLPKSCAVLLPDGITVRCCHCRFLCSMAPCMVCGRATEDVAQDDAEYESDVPLTTPAFPTHHLPGTPSKMNVMRSRLARGESAFHAGDRHFGTRLPEWAGL